MTSVDDRTRFFRGPRIWEQVASLLGDEVWNLLQEQVSGPVTAPMEKVYWPVHVRIRNGQVGEP